MFGYIFLFLLPAVSGLNITEEQYNSFPRLFHLDDYQRCLAARRGLYCIGSFTLAAAGNNSHFHLLQEYSKLRVNFNRTRLHRGYCVSERCPFEQNATLRFERCVAKRARRYSLSAHLSAAECTTHRSRQERANLAPDAAQRLFLYAVYFILFLNVVGTVCDVYSKPGDDTWKLLKCWSVPTNWQKMVKNIENTDSIVKPLASIQGLRAMAMIVTIGGHTVMGRIYMYAYHPHITEQYFKSSLGQVLSNSISLLHLFVMISSFLTTYIIIVFAEKYDLTIKLLPLAIFKRVVRVSPTHIFMVGFAATWWYSLGDGPLWSSLIGPERNNCRTKFWAHVFYINNLVDNNNGICLLPTWFLAADFHTNVVVSGLALIMAKWGRKALFSHAFLFILFSVVNTIVAYVNEWKPLIYSIGPEKFRTFYTEYETRQLYMSSWILIPSCIAGMFCAHLHVELLKVGYKPSEHQWVKLLFNIILPAIVFGVVSGIFLEDNTSPLSNALQIGILRPVLCMILGLGLVVSFQYQEHILYKIFAWKFWYILSRLSLPVLMIHWCVLMTIAATTQHAMSSTYNDVIFDWLVVLVITYVFAIPVSVLLEIPAQKFLETLVFRQKIKTN